MAWICCEGIDRSGKSTVAEFYKTQGYEVIHLSAPDRKYSKPGYIGNTYFEDMVELLVSKTGKDVFWDRSFAGERVWPFVYGREPQLTEEDVDYLRELEDQNQTQRILMVDTDLRAHWKRCVDNKEPLTAQQFQLAHQLYSAMAHKYGFSVLSLPQFLEANNVKPIAQNVSVPPPAVAPVAPAGHVPSPTVVPEKVPETKLTESQQRLEVANAINSVLNQSRVLKKHGWPYDDLEKDIRSMLNDKLGDLLGHPSEKLSKEDVSIVREFVKRLKEKAK
jgi:hypothetical protein